MKSYTNLQGYLVETRRSLHRIPETGTHLPLTAAYVEKELEAMGIAYRKSTKDSSIIALIEGAKPGKVVALRADMDALPIREETGLPYASQNGNMHACGHDGHTAMLLGAAKLLNEQRDTLSGSVKLLFQTGEETCEGAKILLEEGALQSPKVDALVSMHIGSILGNKLKLGQLGVSKGCVMASYDKFILDVKGMGCHGSTPEKGVDPVTIAMAIINALQLIVSREISATSPAVLTIGIVHAGFAYNIIPDSVHIEGTIRATEQSVREHLAERIRDTAQGIATSMRGSCDYQMVWGAPPVVNNVDVTELVAATAIELFGEEKVVTDLGAPNMGGEDIAHLLNNVPGCFLFLGSNNPAKGTDIPHHNCKFDIDEDVLWQGSAILVESAKKLLNT